MKKKLTGVLICILLIAVSFGVIGQPIITNQQNEPLPNEALPIVKKKEIPAPWQFWQENEGGIFGIIVLYKSVQDSVAIVRDYVVLDYVIPLENLTWENTSDLDWVPIDNPGDPLILNPAEEVEYNIPLLPSDSAALIRYTVAWASKPSSIETHFINEAILESTKGSINGSLSNFDVHNSYNKEIKYFDLKIYGDIKNTDVLGIYDPPGDPYTSGNIWYGGWGAPAKIFPIAFGIEIRWNGSKNPVQPGDWFHCGVTLNSNVTPSGAKAYLSVFETSGDAAANLEFSIPRNRIVNRPFLWFLQSYPNMFQILQYLLGL